MEILAYLKSNNFKSEQDLINLIDNYQRQLATENYNTNKMEIIPRKFYLDDVFDNFMTTTRNEMKCDIYEKDGKEERFDLGHLPDSTWTFVRTETTAREGYSDEDLLDLSFYDNDGNYQDSLACGERVMAVSIYDPQMSGKKWTRTEKFVKNAHEAGFTVIILISAEPERIDEATEKVLAPLMYYADYKTLISMNRSNGGITYFSDGYLVRKWAANAAPDLKELRKISSEDVTETIIGQNTKGSLGFQGFLLYVFAVMLLL